MTSYTNAMTIFVVTLASCAAVDPRLRGTQVHQTSHLGAELAGKVSASDASSVTVALTTSRRSPIFVQENRTNEAGFVAAASMKGGVLSKNWEIDEEEEKRWIIADDCVLNYIAFMHEEVQSVVPLMQAHMLYLTGGKMEEHISSLSWWPVGYVDWLRTAFYEARETHRQPRTVPESTLASEQGLPERMSEAKFWEEILKSFRQFSTSAEQLYQEMIDTVLSAVSVQEIQNRVETFEIEQLHKVDLPIPEQRLEDEYVSWLQTIKKGWARRNT